jgi:transposase
MCQAEICPVPVKSVEQQALQQLHRLRSQWIRTRTARINQPRAALREFGIFIPVGAKRAVTAIREALEEAGNGLPDVLRPFVLEVLQEIAQLEERNVRIDSTLRELTREDAVVQRLLKIPGIGLLTASALREQSSSTHGDFPPEDTLLPGWASPPVSTHPASDDA